MPIVATVADQDGDVPEWERDGKILIGLAIIRAANVSLAFSTSETPPYL